MYPEVENASIFPLKALVLWHDYSQDVLVERQGFQGRQEPAVLCAKTNGHMQLAEKRELSAKFRNTTKMLAEELLCWCLYNYKKSYTENEMIQTCALFNQTMIGL